MNGPVSLPPSATPDEMRTSLLATLALAESSGELNARSAEVLREVLVPFATLFTKRRKCGEGGAELAAMTDVAVSALIGHLFLNGTPKGLPVAVALDMMLGNIRARVISTLIASIGPTQGARQ